MNSNIDILENIQSVKAPDIDFATLKAKVDYANRQQLSPTILITAFSSVVVLLSLNLFVLNTLAQKKQQQELNAAFSSIVNNNSLY